MGYIVWNIKDLANTVLEMQNNKFDCIIVFDGARGLGKSTGAIKIASRFLRFSMKKDIVFSREDVIKQLARKKYGVIIADEMINVTYNREFYAEDQKKIIKMLNMYRDSCNLFIACVPNFADLDPQFRSLVKIRISVVRRGMAIVHTQNQSKFSRDPWDMKINEKIESEWLKRRNAKPQYHKLTTFRGILVYGDLRAKQRRIYEAIKAEKRNRVVELDHISGGDEEKATIYHNITKLFLERKITTEDYKKFCLINALDVGLATRKINYLIKKKDPKSSIKKLLKEADIGVTKLKEMSTGKIIYKRNII